MTAHFVYEFYDESGNALYVGCTAALSKRIGQHAAGRDWWPDVACIEANRYPDFEAGRQAEAERIRELQPRHNLIHTDREQVAIERVLQGRIANRAKRHDLGLKCSPWNGCPTCKTQRVMKRNAA